MLHEQRFFFLASKAIAFALSRVYGRSPFTGYLSNVINPTATHRTGWYRGRRWLKLKCRERHSKPPLRADADRSHGWEAPMFEDAHH